MVLSQPKPAVQEGELHLYKFHLKLGRTLTLSGYALATQASKHSFTLPGPNFQHEVYNFNKQATVCSITESFLEM